MARALRAAEVRDPDVTDQFLRPERALRELVRIRAVTFTAGARTIEVVTRRSPLQSRILAALGVDTSGAVPPHHLTSVTAASHAGPCSDNTAATRSAYQAAVGESAGTQIGLYASDYPVERVSLAPVAS